MNSIDTAIRLLSEHAKSILDSNSLHGNRSTLDAETGEDLYEHERVIAGLRSLSDLEEAEIYRNRARKRKTRPKAGKKKWREEKVILEEELIRMAGVLNNICEFHSKWHAINSDQRSHANKLAIIAFEGLFGNGKCKWLGKN